MGKVRDEVSAKSSKPAPKGSAGAKPSRLGPFFINLVRTDVFKPTQGKNARLWTAVGLGALVAAGLYRAFDLYFKDMYSPGPRYALVAGLGAAFAWFIWRLIQYPPFADFLIATEAEMRKVSWTTPEALKRATIVVLVTIFVMAFYLFAVDFLWGWLLQVFRVLRISSDDMGSQ